MPKHGNIPSPMLGRLVVPAALSLPSGLFNHRPQCPELGITPRGAYIFSLNVVLLALRLVNQGLLSQARDFSRGLLTKSVPGVVG